MITDANTTIVTPRVSKVPPREPATRPPTETIAGDNPIMAPIVVVKPTEAAAFINARPGGPRQQETQLMVAVGRRISSHLQKKATTSPEGQPTLLVLTKNLAQQNKENTPAPTKLVQKCKSSSSATSKTTAKGPLHKRGKLQAAGIQKKKQAHIVPKPSNHMYYRATMGVHTVGWSPCNKCNPTTPGIIWARVSTYIRRTAGIARNHLLPCSRIRSEKRSSTIVRWITT